MEMNYSQMITALEEFAAKHGLELSLDGEVGFGRDCVGFLKGGSYVAFNPIQAPEYDYVPGFYNEQFYAVKALNAYHKHDCLAVLTPDGDKDYGVKQLYEWITKLEALGELEVAKYDTGNRGLQAMFTGMYDWAIRLKERASVEVE